MEMSAEELSFSYATKKVEQNKEWKEAVIGQLWPASGGRLTGQLPPGCLADSGQTSLTNEGPGPVHWGKLSTSWAYGNKINLK